MFYKKYRLSGPVIRYVDEDEMRLLMAAEWIVNEEDVLRNTAKKYGYAYQSLWTYIHRDLKELCPELYEKTAAQLQKNRVMSYRACIRAQKGETWYGCWSGKSISKSGQNS